MRNMRQVVVTGLGTVNALGTNSQEFWQRLIAGESGIGEVTSFDSTDWRTHIGCEVKSPLPETGHPDRVHDLLISAAKEALQQAGGSLPREMTAVVIGTLQGGIITLEQAISRQVKSNLPIDIRSSYSTYIVSGVSRYVASTFGFQGPVTTPTIACAASGAAISRATDLIRLGYVDAAITGGADAFAQNTFSGFNAMRSAAPNECRPFSVNREGLVIGEGAGVLVLEALESAQIRGAKPLAVVLGTGLAEDAHHITAPEPNGTGAVHAMQAALTDAELLPNDIHYINAHGTGTLQNDKMETRALKTVFQEHASQIPVSSIKAAVGHCMGAAGAVEAVASVLTLLNQILPPTLNFTPGDPECTLDYVPDKARPAEIRTVLSNSFGFAGNNASLIFGIADKIVPKEVAA